MVSNLAAMAHVRGALAVMIEGTNLAGRNSSHLQQAATASHCDLKTSAVAFYLQPHFRLGSFRKKYARREFFSP